MIDWKDRLATWGIWIGMTIYMLWVFAKMFGLINTPEAVLMLPYAAAGLVLISYFVKVGKYLGKFDLFEFKLNSLEKNMREVKKELSYVDKKLFSIGKELSDVDKRLFRVEMKLQ